MKVWRASNPQKEMLLRTRNRAKRKGFAFNITLDDLGKIPEVCPILGIPLKINVGSGLHPDSPSVDRIVPNKGYTKGNVRIISTRANHLKSNATVEELEKILEDARSIRQRERSSDTEQGS